MSALSEIYKWTDERGNVHFGDSPKDKDNAEKIVVEVNSYENVTYDDIQFYQGSESNNVTMYGPPRVLRRLQSLREWSHEETTQVFPRSPRTGCPYGTGASR